MIEHLCTSLHFTISLTKFNSKETELNSSNSIQFLKNRIGLDFAGRKRVKLELSFLSANKRLQFYDAFTFIKTILFNISYFS